MMERRRFFLAGLGGLAAAMLADRAEAGPEDVLREVQYGPPPGYGGPPPGYYGPPPRRRRRRRCWVERVRVPRRDRWGRVFYVIREREVCR